MAALTVRAVKLAVFSGAAVPLIGYSGRLSAQSLDGDVEEQSKPIRVCDLPMYPMANRNPEAKTEEPESEPNAVQKQITVIRKYGTSVYDDVMERYEEVKKEAYIGYHQTKDILHYVQNNPGDLPRVGVITMASLGGFVIGFRRKMVRRLLYATVAGLSATAICYPHHSVDLSRALAEDCKSLWKDNIGWPLIEQEDNKSKKTPASKAPTESKVISLLKGKEDHGQSKSEDKDLYSTRST